MNVTKIPRIEKTLKEILFHVPDEWRDRNKDRIGHEINFTKEHISELGRKL